MGFLRVAGIHVQKSYKNIFVFNITKKFHKNIETLVVVWENSNNVEKLAN